MHQEKVSRMSHKGFFLSRTQKEILFGNFSWMFIFKNN
jgi:hypothetical protein